MKQIKEGVKATENLYTKNLFFFLPPLFGCVLCNLHEGMICQGGFELQAPSTPEGS